MFVTDPRAQLDHACAYATTAEELDVVAPFPEYSAADLVIAPFKNNPEAFAQGRRLGGSGRVPVRRAARELRRVQRPRAAARLQHRRPQRRGLDLAHLPERGAKYGGHSHRGLARAASRTTGDAGLSARGVPPDGVAFANGPRCRRGGSHHPSKLSQSRARGFEATIAGSFTRDSYEFCGLSTIIDVASEAATADGDGVTPLSSALDFAGAERLTLAETTIHAANLPSFLSPELAESDAPWYGDEARIDEWASGVSAPECHIDLTVPP